MSKERYNEIIDEVYKNYIYKQPYQPIAGNNVGKLGSYKNPILSKEEFINKIKTDDEFSEKSSLQIEERELSFDERCSMLSTKPQAYDIVEAVKNVLIRENIPTKEIKVTYNNETITVYE